MAAPIAAAADQPTSGESPGRATAVNNGSEAASTSPPPTPCTHRNGMSAASELEAPHPIEARPKMIRPATSVGVAGSRRAKNATPTETTIRARL